MRPLDHDRLLAAEVLLGETAEPGLIEESLRAILESAARVHDILDSMPQIIWVADADGACQYLNPQWYAFTGRTGGDLGSGWIGAVHAEDLEAFTAVWQRSLATGMPFEAEFRLRHVSGAYRWTLSRAVPKRGAADGTVRWYGTCTDITDQKESEERVRWIANHDSLTGLPNRLLFQERLDRMVRGSAGSSFALLLLDIDEFKRVNDTLGHDAGDALLCAFAERLQRAARADDLVARLGGDEFAVILNGVGDEDGVAAAVESLLTALRVPWVHGSALLDCDASIGASLYPADGDNRAELLKHADIALYVAKAAGRGNLKLFRPTMRAEMQNRVSMLSLARSAMERDWIVPFYQPKVDLRSGALAGFEALLRWHHPGKGIQTPDTIAAAFEDLTIAAGISDRMIARIIRDIRHWLDSGVDFGHVAINAAAAEFRTGDFAERLLERLEAASVPPELIQLEVTETVFLGRGAECVGRTLRALSGAGVKIALDDFGTGYASLSHLKQFPVDLLKIDRSFVRDLAERPDAAAIVRAVINLGHSLDIRIVAEGIETAEQQARLVAQGCDYGQGFLYSPAVPAEAVAALVAAPEVRRAG